MTELWVCVTHGLPEGTCDECSVVETCPPDRTFTPGEVAEALAKARRKAREGEQRRIRERMKEMVSGL